MPLVVLVKMHLFINFSEAYAIIMTDESADASALVESIPTQVLLQVSNEIAVRRKCNAAIFGNIYEV